jgi:hypothetical protein
VDEVWNGSKKHKERDWKTEAALLRTYYLFLKATGKYKTLRKDDRKLFLFYQRVYGKSKNKVKLINLKNRRVDCYDNSGKN